MTKIDVVAREKDNNIRRLCLDMIPEQQHTEPNGEPLLSPHVPDGEERVSV